MSNSSNKLKYIYIFTFLCISYLIFNRIFTAFVSNYALGELLINYEGGFVRRGLLGQIFQFFERPGYVVNLFQKSIVFLFLLLSLIYLFLEINKTLIFQFVTILIFSSGGMIDFLTSKFSFDYLDRKEILFYCVLLFLLLLKFYYPIKSLVWVVTCAISSSLMILVHELFAVFFIPGLYYIIYLNTYSNKKLFIKSSLIFLLPTSIIFLLVFLNHGDKETAIAIFKSYEFTDVQNIYKVNSGIKALAWSLDQSHSLSVRMFEYGSIYPWIFYYLFNLILFIFIAYFSNNNLNNFIISMIILFLLLPGLIIASYAGWDWGRFISISAIGYALLLSINFSQYRVMENSLENKDFPIYRSNNETYKTWKTLIIFGFIILLVLLSFSSTMPQCCPQKSLSFF